MNKENKNPVQAAALNHEEPVFLEYVAKSIASSDAFDRMVRALAPHLVKRWAGKHVLKKIIAAPVARSIQKGFSSDNKGEEENVLDDPLFARAVLRELPEILNSLLLSVGNVMKNISALPDDEKEKLAGEFISKLDARGIAEILNEGMKALNGVHYVNTTFLSEHLSPFLSEFLKQVDFGQLKEAIEKSADDVEGLVKHVNESLWEYPAKVICLLGMIPALANILLRSLTETIVPINRLAPDLLTDVVLSLANDVEGKRIGILINELCELVRKLHTGSALLGEPGKPQLPRVAGRLADDVLNAVDAAAFVRAMDLLSDIKHMMFLSFADAVEKKPELVRGLLRSKFRVSMRSIKRMSRTLELLESSLQDDESVAVLSNAVQDIDPQELASLVERACVLFNRMREGKPEVFRNAVSQWATSVDPYEATRAVEGIVEDVVEALRPIAPQVMPPLVRGFADLISEDDGTGEMESALEKLRKALLGKEVMR